MGDRVGVELLFNSVEFESKRQSWQRQLRVELQPVEAEAVEFDAQGGSWVEDRTELLTKCGRESHIRPKGPLGPDEWSLGLRLSSPREQKGHNVTVITAGSKYCSYVRSPALSNPCNKVRGKILLKKSSCVVYHCVFVTASLSLCRCELFYIYMCMYVDVNLHMWLYNSMSRVYVTIHVFFFYLWSLPAWLFSEYYVWFQPTDELLG